LYWIPGKVLVAILLMMLGQHAMKLITLVALIPRKVLVVILIMMLDNMHM